MSFIDFQPLSPASTGPRFPAVSVDPSTQQVLNGLPAPTGTSFGFSPLGGDPFQVRARPRAPLPVAVDNSHPLKLHHDGGLKDIPITKPRQFQELIAKRQEFHGFLNTVSGQNVTAYRYQFSQKRVIFYAGGHEHILKIDSSNRDHDAISKCIRELEDLVFQIRGEGITYSSYNSESVTLTGKTSPHYKVMTPVLSKLANSTFKGGIGLAKKHYLASNPGVNQAGQVRQALVRLRTFKRNVNAEITRLGPLNTPDDKKKLAALKALKDKLDNLNGRDGYQLVWALLINVVGKDRNALITDIEAERVYIQARWAEEENADSDKWGPKVKRYFSSETDAMRTAREDTRRQKASLDYSADIAGLVFTRAFDGDVNKGRIANEQYRNKHSLYGEQRVELGFLIVHLGRGSRATARKCLEAQLQGLTPASAQTLSGALIP